jgi:hypothetical protein
MTRWFATPLCRPFLKFVNGIKETFDVCCAEDPDQQSDPSIQLLVENTKSKCYRFVLLSAFRDMIRKHLDESKYREAMEISDDDIGEYELWDMEEGQWRSCLEDQTEEELIHHFLNAKKVMHGEVLSETHNIATAAKPGPDYFLRAFFDVWNSACIGMDGILPVSLEGAMNMISKSRDFFSGGVAFAVKAMIWEAGEHLRSTIESICAIGPYRELPQRLYVLSGATPRGVGDRGQYVPDLLFRRPDLVQQTNHWLDRLDIGYHVEPTELRSGTQDLFELRLFDLRRGTPVEVGLADVGFGVSQLLPLVVQSLGSEKQIITIEQPEVHVHPRLQAEIADLLIEGIQEPRNHQFIVETHSEHLILRLLRRIRETERGNLPEGHPGLTSEQLSVIYVQRTDSGSQAHRIEIDANGEFLQPWPDDFFELDFHERFS